MPSLYWLFIPFLIFNTPQVEEAHLGGYWYGVPDPQYVIVGQWVKIDSRWETTETEDGVYDWSYLDEAVSVIRRRGGFVMINVHNTPAWARTSEYKCAFPDRIFHLARFVQLIVNRYGPEAVSIWNEPEMSAETSASLEYCCGCVPPDVYRATVNALYQGITWGETRMLAGELLVDETWINAMFSATVRADGLSFHHYQYGLDVDPARLDAVKAYLRSKTSMPLWLTETSVLSESGTFDFRAAQADWLRIVAPMDYAAIIWYAQNDVGWNQCNMLSGDTMFPVYDAFRELMTEYQSR